MRTTQILQGTLKPDGTLELTGKAELPAGPVEVVLRTLAPPPTGGEDWWEFLQRFRAELEAEGYPFMNEEEVQAHIEDLRSGDERIEEVYRQIDQLGRQEHP